jgi:hypothetical protein
MDAISLESVIERDDEPIAAKVDEEVVMLSARAQAYFGLGDIGSRIWSMLDRPRRAADICDELVNTYDVERSTCERDVLAFLGDLLNERLIRIVGGAQSSP